MLNFISKLLNKIKAWVSAAEGGFLCDTCKYDYPSACNNPKRPNAKKCSEYSKR
jgi:hypothetical protein